MKKNFFWLISVLVALFFVSNQNINQAQVNSAIDIYMFGTIEKDDRMSGYFGKNGQDFKNKTWCVFIGENGKVYKLTLIDRNIHELYIDGQKVADGEIWRHTGEYKSFLEKFWRNEEIEQESRELEQQIKPLDGKMEAIAKEIEKLDREEEKLDRKSENNFAAARVNLNAQQKRLSEIEEKLEKQIEALSKQQEKLSNEQESLELIGDLNKVLLRIGTDLKSLGVISSTKNLSFKISNIELIVNGKRVSSGVFELLKTRYIVESKGESGFIYRWKW